MREGKRAQHWPEHWEAQLWRRLHCQHCKEHREEPLVSPARMAGTREGVRRGPAPSLGEEPALVSSVPCTRRLCASFHYRLL